MSETKPGLAEAGPGKQDLAAHEEDAIRDAAAELALPLSEELRALRDHLVAAFPDAEVVAFRGELTLSVEPDRLLAVLAFARDDPAVRCELLADLSGVHWPAGRGETSFPEVTGWPAYDTGDDTGRIEVNYLLRSLEHGHAFRVRTSTPDAAPVLPSATPLYGAANLMEREVYDFFGVAFTGHPDLRRIFMPDEWEGHPQRKDYPLGGVEVDYLGKTVPPPDERTY